MKRLLTAWLTGCLGLPVLVASAQFSLTGTHAPGDASSFTFTPAGGTTNLSLVVSNHAASWSHLLLKRGGPATDTDYDAIARLDGRTNQISIGGMDLGGTPLGVRVRTPSNSAARAFVVLVSTNRTDLGTAGRPWNQPVEFQAGGRLTSPGSAAWQFYQVDVPTNRPGWRFVLNSTGGPPADLYLRRDQPPTAGTYDRRITGSALATLTLTAGEVPAGTWFIGVNLPGNAAASVGYMLTADAAGVRPLAWDDGSTPAGSAPFPNPGNAGGDHYFRVVPQAGTAGAWRTVLQVSAGEADLYLRSGAGPADRLAHHPGESFGPGPLRHPAWERAERNQQRRLRGGSGIDARERAAGSAHPQ